MTRLYKKDNTGKIRVWDIEEQYDTLLIAHGYLQGSLVRKIVPVQVNQSGRSIDEQIDLEMNSRINKQLDRGYALDITTAEVKEMSNSMDLPLPMLAQPLNKVKKLPARLLWQYKYDGMRCLIYNGPDGKIAYSRQGKRIETINHILEDIAVPYGGVVDGELYIHDSYLQAIMSLAKRFQTATRELNYIMYDYVSDTAYGHRHQTLVDIEKDSGSCVKVAPTHRLNPDDDAIELMKSAQHMGYEGLILRDPSIPYATGKRSTSLIKVKSVDDEDFMILDITSSKDGHAILHCTNFAVIAPGTHEFKAHVLLHARDYIGQQVRVEYANKTKDGVPFHPVATHIIED